MTQSSDPQIGEPDDEDARASQPRPFRSWASAHEESKPGFWSRLFSRKNPAPDAAPFALEPVAESDSRQPGEPDSDLKFFEAPTEIVPELALHPKPGFFMRLFRRKKQAPAEPATRHGQLDEEPLVPTNEYPAEITEPESFVSVEDALPAPRESAAPIRESKAGGFSRFFGSRKKQRPSLEIEIHEERIAAAADALQEVGDKTFAEQLAEPVTSDSFGSVEEALPDVTVDHRFAPPAQQTQREPVEANSDVLDFIVDPPAEPETKPSEREVQDGAGYFGVTLDPDKTEIPELPELPQLQELERDTDEFEVVNNEAAFAETQPGIGVDDDTAQVSRKSLIARLLSWRSKSQEAVSATATVVEAPPVFLFSKFRMFYNEIIRLMHQKTELSAGFSTAIMTDSNAELSPDGTAESTSKSLAQMLELQAAEAMWMGGEAAERYPEAQYAMTALADDLLLHAQWEGQPVWHKYSLEQKLFKTRAADVELYRRIDKLLKDQPDSAAARDLARVYLFVIAAGFKGKYRPFGLTRALAEYRQRLYEFIHRGADALLLYDGDRKIFPETAQSTLVGHAVSRFSAAQRWAAILVFLVASYTVIAHVAWTRVSADLEDVTAHIKTTTTTP